MTFQDLTLIPPLLRAVDEAGYHKPSPIQEKAIPPVLAGRDLLGCAQTGTGKTAAFALPILQLLQARKPERKCIRTLVLTPTRELALQIDESFQIYGKHLPLRSTVIFGGVGQAPQVAALQRGVDILVATPGRLNDLIGQGYVKLDGIEIFVLDEADRMLDMGFVQDVKKVIRFLPQKRQTLLFSATMPPEIVALADSLLHKPAKVFVTPPATTVEKIEQHLYKVDKANKRRLLASLLQDTTIVSALVFTRTKHGADRVVRDLKRDGIQALAIHGNKSQTARQTALARFKDGKTRVLVATDIAARGLDINELSHVINYDLPNIPETYVHRIGRTGRAGHTGVAISFCSAEELPYLADIEKLIGFSIPETTGHAWPMQSPSAEPQKKPARLQQPQARTNEKQPKNRGKQNTANRNTQKSDAKQKNATMAAGAAASAHPAGQGAPASVRPARAETEVQHNAARQNTAGRRNAGAKPRQQASNPYENRTGGSAIVTKRPVWSTGSPLNDTEPNQQKGDADMSRNNRRRRGGKNRNGQNSENTGTRNGQQQANKEPVIKKNEKGLFDFSEEELAEDTSLRLIGDTSHSEAKYASFEDYLKDH